MPFACHVQRRGALPFFTRFYVAPPIPPPHSACPKPARRGERLANAARSRKLSELAARAGDNDDLVFVTSDSISIFLATIVSSDP